MSKTVTFTKLEILLDGKDMDFLLQAMFNYFSADELEEFTEFVEEEIEGGA